MHWLLSSVCGAKNAQYSMLDDKGNGSLESGRRPKQDMRTGGGPQHGGSESAWHLKHSATTLALPSGQMEVSVINGEHSS